MAKVSIIVPVYDIEAYLRRCVDSLIAQTLNDIEIILVDDGSTDSSGKICDEYADKDGRIRVIHKANGGLSDALRKCRVLTSEELFGKVLRNGDTVSMGVWNKLYSKRMDHAIYCYLSAKHPDLLSTVSEYLCVSDLYIARSMALSNVHDHTMYERIKDEVELLLPESERTGLLSRKDDLELKIMCLGYLPYHAFIRLRQAKRRLCSEFSHSDKSSTAA